MGEMAWWAFYLDVVQVFMLIIIFLNLYVKIEK
jgi:hypothetical protein